MKFKGAVLVLLRSSFSTVPFDYLELGLGLRKLLCKSAKLFIAHPSRLLEHVNISAIAIIFNPRA
jgi:hypothetical protein